VKPGRRIGAPRSEDVRPQRGRGAVSNPTGRYEPRVRETDPELVDEPREIRPETILIEDKSRSIVSTNDSPDIGFDASVNPYRGCEHGCSYCYARPTHEYLGYSAGLDFESKILVKRNAAALLRAELAKPSWKPKTVAFSGVTDCYQPAERNLKLTRGCLEVLAECRNPAGIVTKNHLVTRDADLLSELAKFGASCVVVSIPTLDAELSGRLEPRASRPVRRLAAIEALAKAGIPVGVNVAPIIPGLTDSDIARVIQAAANAGATFAGMTMLRLPLTVAPIFTAWLDENEPGRKEKILNRVREVRGGKLNESGFGDRMRGHGIYAEQARRMFELSCKKHGIASKGPKLAAAHFRRPRGPQGELFET